MTAMAVGRALTALAALALLAVVLLNVVPVRMTGWDESEHRRGVSCGTFLFPTDDSFSDLCEDARVGPLMAGFFLWLASLPVGAAGLALLYRAVQRL